MDIAVNSRTIETAYLVIFGKMFDERPFPYGVGFGQDSITSASECHTYLQNLTDWLEYWCYCNEMYCVFVDGELYLAADGDGDCGRINTTYMMNIATLEDATMPTSYIKEV